MVYRPDSTGLDPGARLDMWSELQALNQSDGVTVLVTTHLMEDAERCHRLMILDEGRRIALDTPGALKDTLGGNVITIRAEEPAALAAAIRDKLHLNPRVVEGTVRIETGNRGQGHQVLARVAEHFAGELDTLTLAQPTLEDVFIHHTGHQFLTE